MRVEPFLMKLNVEEQTMRRTAKKNNEHRLDVSVKRFWVNGQNAFFDVMVFDLTLGGIRTKPSNSVTL